MAETNDLVSFSRAGDVFHYRWAARRCLKLLDFNSPLECVVIEGSKEKIAGEYSVDVSEYNVFKNNIKTVDYFQLKHSTSQLDKFFTLSLLKDTFVGFAKRFRALQKENHDYQSVKFSIITNRPISSGFKKSIMKLSKGEEVDSRFKETIEKYSKLKGKNLLSFCKAVYLVDGEGNYDAQKYEIHKDLAKLTSSDIDTNLVDSIVELVRSRVLTPMKNKIIREDVLKLFNKTSERELFPAPPELEGVEGCVLREQHKELRAAIVNAKNPMVISAESGVGKSVVCCQLAIEFSNQSFAVAYDCFGNGKYRKLSEKRHRAIDAFVQISNELAIEGLCDPLISFGNDQDVVLVA